MMKHQSKKTHINVMYVNIKYIYGLFQKIINAYNYFYKYMQDCNCYIPFLGGARNETQGLEGGRETLYLSVVP